MEHSNYSGHLHILEVEEIAHIYALPDFTPDERVLFFTLTATEREQVYCKRDKKVILDSLTSERSYIFRKQLIS